MAYELFYTSAPKGLRPQTSGICTVGMTRGFPAPFIARLEALSGYRPPFEGASLADCPIAYSHWIIEAGGVTRHILAAVRATKPDHTLRSNKLAHYLLLREEEHSKLGPAWILSQPNVMSSEWIGEPREFDTERKLPTDTTTSMNKCQTWEALTGDAGWAGVIANAAMLDSKTPCSIVYPKGTEVLDLVHEALLLIPPELRWRITFSTYFMEPFAGLRCAWRFCLDGTPAANAARQSSGLTIDLCMRSHCDRKGKLIDAARTGKIVELGRNRMIGTASGLLPENPNEFVSGDPPLIRSAKFASSGMSNSVSPNNIQFGLRASRERLSRVGFFAVGFFLAMIIAAGLFLLRDRGVTSPNNSQPIKQPSGIVAPPGVENAIVQPPSIAISDDVVKTVETERLRNEQIAIEAKRVSDENLATNKSLLEQLESIKAELKTANEKIASNSEKTLPPPIASPVQKIDFIASMPTSTGSWKVFKLPKPTKDTFGNFEGIKEITSGSNIKSVKWFPLQPVDKKEMSPFDISERERKIFVKSDKGFEVAEVAIDETATKVSFRWTAIAATLQSNPLLSRDLEAYLRDKALVIGIDDREEWHIFQPIQTSRLAPERPLQICRFSKNTLFHYSIDGDQWVVFKNGEVDIPIPVKDSFICRLEITTSDSGEFLIGLLHYPPNLNKQALDACSEAIEESREKMESAEQEYAQIQSFQGFDPEVIKLRKQAKVAYDTAKYEYEDAQKKKEAFVEARTDLSSKVEKIRCLIGPVSAIPIAELQYKLPSPRLGQ